MTLYLYPTDGLFLASVLALLAYFFRLHPDHHRGSAGHRRSQNLPPALAHLAVVA